MKLAVLLVGAAVWLFAPAAADAAYSGSITNVQPSGDGYTVSATYTTTTTAGSCTDYGFCSWFSVAGQVSAGEACPPSAPDALTYVGDGRDAPGTVTGTDTFYPNAAAVRLCLYIHGPDLTDHLVAAYDYGGASPGPSPTPGGSSSGGDVPPLTVADTRATLPTILRRKFGSRFRHRGHYWPSCHRRATEKVRCRVRWQSGRFRYSGTVTMWNDPADPANSILYTYSIRRQRVHAPRRHAPPPRPSCDPNYAGACLNPNASDYDCLGGSGNGPFYTGRVRVVARDHFQFDRDGDGIGCDES